MLLTPQQQTRLRQAIEEWCLAHASQDGGAIPAADERLEDLLVEFGVVEFNPMPQVVAGGAAIMRFLSRMKLFASVGALY
jgi:hypothetical protein